MYSVYRQEIPWQLFLLTAYVPMRENTDLILKIFSNIINVLLLFSQYPYMFTLLSVDKVLEIIFK